MSKSKRTTPKGKSKPALYAGGRPRMSTPEVEGAAARARRLLEDLTSMAEQLERGARDREHLRRLDRIASKVDALWLAGGKLDTEHVARLLEAVAEGDDATARTMLIARVPEVAGAVTDEDLREARRLLASRAHGKWKDLAALISRVLDLDMGAESLKKLHARRAR